MEPKTIEGTVFAKWLREQLAIRGWSQRTLAREAGVSYTSVSNKLTGQYPSWKFCAAIAKAFNIPCETVLQKAGLLLTVPEQRSAEHLANLILALGDDDQQVVVRIVLALAKSNLTANSDEQD